MAGARWCAWGLWALLAPTPALAQAPGDAGAPADAGPARPAAAPAGTGVVVTRGEAHRRLPNTVSDVTVSVEVHGADIRAAAALLARQSGALLGYLRAQGTERLRTESTAFEPETQEVRGRPDRIKGFTGRGAVSFRTTPDRLPALLAGCLDNGATGVSQSGSSPREAEVEAARQELLAEASRIALAQAQAVARALDQRVTGIQRVVVDPPPGPEGDALPAAPMMDARARRSAPPIASEAGDAGVEVSVALTARIGPPG